MWQFVLTGVKPDTNIPREGGSFSRENVRGRAQLLGALKAKLDSQSDSAHSSGGVFKVPLPDGTMVSLPKLPMISMCD